MTSTVSDESRRAPSLSWRGLIERLRADGIDLRNTWQVVAGALLLPIGVAVIVLGWHGAAHGRVDQQQIPYLISGGILGLAAVMIGGFFFWAHWLYRIYDQADLHHREAMREQAELYRALLAAVGQWPVAGAPGASAATSDQAYVATPTGSLYHLASCPVVASRPSLRMITRAQARSMKACRICEPAS
jgi:hypothetical protein